MGKDTLWNWRRGATVLWSALLVVVIAGCATAPPRRTAVVVKPGKGAVVHNKKPHPHAMWVKGHYKYRGGRYVWVPGHWKY